MSKFVQLVKKEQSWTQSKLVELIRDGLHKVKKTRRTAVLKTAILKHKSGSYENILDMLSIILDLKRKLKKIEKIFGLIFFFLKFLLFDLFYSNNKMEVYNHEQILFIFCKQ